MDDTSLLTANNRTAAESGNYTAAEDYENNYFGDNDPDGWVTEMFGFRPPTLMMIYSGIAVLGLLGLVGNVISLVVWTRPQLKSSSSLLLTVLAACDSLILITGITPNYLNVLCFNYHDSLAIAYMDKFIYPYVYVGLNPVYRTAQTASTYLTLAITSERYIAVSRPFQARFICTYSRACKYAAAIITVSILYNLVRYLSEKVVSRVDDNGDITSYGIGDTELSRSPLYQSIYQLYGSWLYLILTFLLPLICIAVLNTLIYLEMKRMKNLRQDLTSSQRKENRTTMMLVYVVAEFLVCSSVTVLYTITVRILKLSREQLGFSPLNVAPLLTFFETFNSSSNVLTYFVFGSSFREALLSTFTCCRGFCRKSRSNRTDSGTLDVGTIPI